MPIQTKCVSSLFVEIREAGIARSVINSKDFAVYSLLVHASPIEERLTSSCPTNPQQPPSKHPKPPPTPSISPPPQTSLTKPPQPPPLIPHPSISTPPQISPASPPNPNNPSPHPLNEQHSQPHPHQPRVSVRKKPAKSLVP